MKVLCIEKPPCLNIFDDITVGKEYKVREERKGCYFIIDDTGYICAYHSRYFIPLDKCGTNTERVGEPTEQSYNGNWVMNDGMSSTIKTTRIKI